MTATIIAQRRNAECPDYLIMRCVRTCHFSLRGISVISMPLNIVFLPVGLNNNKQKEK